MHRAASAVADQIVLGLGGEVHIADGDAHAHVEEPAAFPVAHGVRTEFGAGRLDQCVASTLVVTGAGPRKVDEPVEVRPPLETRPRTDGHQHLFDEALGGRGRRLVAIGDDSSVVRVDRHRDHRGAERQHDVIRWSDPPRATPGAPQFSIAEILLSRSASGKEDEAPPLADQDRPS